MKFFKVTFNYGGDLGDENRYYSADSLLTLVSHLRERQQYIKAISIVKKQPVVYTPILNLD